MSSNILTIIGLVILVPLIFKIIISIVNSVIKGLICTFFVVVAIILGAMVYVFGFSQVIAFIKSLVGL